MDFHSEHLGFHSEILGYFEKQKEAKKEAAKALPSVPSFRLEKGSGPYKKWESRPLKAEDGQASTSGEEDDEEVRMPPSRRDKCLRTLFYLNGGLLLFVVIIGAAVGIHGSSSAQHLLRSPHVLGIGLRPDPLRIAAFPPFPYAPAPAPSALPINRPMPLERMFGGAFKYGKASASTPAPAAALPPRVATLPAWAQKMAALPAKPAQTVTSASSASMSDVLAAHAAAQADYWRRAKEGTVRRDDTQAADVFPKQATGGRGSTAVPFQGTSGRASVSARSGVPAAATASRSVPSAAGTQPARGNVPSATATSRGFPSAGATQPARSGAATAGVAGSRPQPAGLEIVPADNGLPSMDQWAPFRHGHAHGAGNLPPAHAKAAPAYEDISGTGATHASTRKADVSDLIPDSWAKLGASVP